MHPTKLSKSSSNIISPIFLLYLVTSLLHDVSVVQSRSLDRNTPHNHHGILTPYSPGPFSNFHLQPEEEVILAEGKPVMKQMADTSTHSHIDDSKKDGGEGQGGRAICIQDVHAPKEAVWRQILDIDSYGDKVSSVKECKNYSFQVNTNKGGNIRFKTKMVIGVMPGYSVRFDFVFFYHRVFLNLFSAYR